VLTVILFMDGEKAKVNSRECNVILKVVVLVGVRQLGDAISANLEGVVPDDHRGVLYMGAEDPMLMAPSSFLGLVLEELVERTASARKPIYDRLIRERPYVDPREVEWVGWLWHDLFHCTERASP
jgi:hypothetical protein